MIDVPAAGNAPSIARTPGGWLALSSRSFGGKAVTGSESVLYRSRDGVTWDRIALDGDNLALRSLRSTSGATWRSQGAASSCQPRTCD